MAEYGRRVYEGGDGTMRLIVERLSDGEIGIRSETRDGSSVSDGVILTAGPFWALVLALVGEVAESPIKSYSDG